MTVRAVLWDADGVLQRLPDFVSVWSFLDADARMRLLAATFADMPDVLTGRIDMGARIARLVEAHGLDAHRDPILAAWSLFPPVEEARALVAAVRRSGVRCVLATNQDSLRAANMRPVYEPLLDRCYFSCTLGLAKPEPAFYDHIVADLGLLAQDVLFVDDSQDNVDGARAAGLRAERWHHDDGVEALEALLAAQGVQATRSSRRE